MKVLSLKNIVIPETVKVLKKAASAHRYLAELKGLVSTIPNESILINTLALQEAKDSSEVENIITTHDELYKTQLFDDYVRDPSAKEVSCYVAALKRGGALVRKNGFLSINNILEIHKELEQNDAGFRKVPGTVLKNQQTGEIVITPPQHQEEIVELMTELEAYINNGLGGELDLLVKMAVIHYQFESIHPFYDGNGRSGRIINILYLVMKGLLDIPVLYLSRHIIRNKADYYRYLQTVREDGNWEDWIIYMLEGIECTSRQTIWLVKRIKALMVDYKHRMREKLPKIYSQELLNNLFSHPYTKIEFIQNDLQVSRVTAGKYLDQLTAAGFLDKNKVGRHNYYINISLNELLSSVPDLAHFS